MACVAGSNGSEMPGCDITCLYYFGSDIESDQPTLRCITQHPLFETICSQKGSLRDRYRGFMSSARNECTKRTIK